MKIVLTCMAMLPVLAIAESNSWLRWRGPNGNGVINGAPFNVEALQTAPKTIWKTNVGYGYSAFCVKGKHAWTMGHADGEDQVVALSSSDGSILWTHTYKEKKGAFSGPRATPVYDEGRLYTISRSGKMFCFEAKTGKVIWFKNLVKDTHALNRRWGIASSVVIEGDRLFINLGLHGLALDKITGKVIWQSPEGKSGFASSVLYSVNAKRNIVNFGETTLHGVEADTGTLLWSIPWATKYAENTADPVVHGSNVFVSSTFGMGCALYDVSGDTPALVWKNNNLASKIGSPIYYKGYLYGIHGNMRGKQKGMLTCLDWKTGETMWTHETDFGSLIIANEKLVVINEHGVLRIADATHKGYKELAKAEVLPGEKRNKNRKLCWTPPVLADGRLYCRNGKGDVVCLDYR